MTKQSNFYVYILSSNNNNVLYTGVTNSLIRRVHEHKSKMLDGFTKKYNVNKLVYFEYFADSVSAITREKQIKAGSRRKKMELIKANNPEFKDLYDEIL